MHMIMLASDLSHSFGNDIISSPHVLSGSHSFSFPSLPHHLSFNFLVLEKKISKYKSPSLWNKCDINFFSSFKFCALKTTHHL